MTELVRVPDRARAGLEIEIRALGIELSYGTGYTPSAEHLMDMVEQALPERIRAMEGELLPVLGLPLDVDPEHMPGNTEQSAGPTNS